MQWHNKKAKINEKYIGDVLMGKTFTIDPISHKRLSNLGEASYIVVFVVVY